MEWFMPAELAPFGGAAALGGRLHNAFLEVIVESGILGLVGYVAMLGAITVCLFGPTRTDQAGMARFRSAVLGSLAANLVAEMFSFEGAATMVLFWTLSGIALAMPRRSLAAQRMPGRGLRWSGAAVGAASILLAFWLVTVDVLAFVGESILVPRGLWRGSASVLALACSLSPTPEVLLAVRGNVYGSWAEAQPAPGRWQRGADVYDELVRRSPGVVSYHRSHGWFLRRWYRVDEDPEVGQRAINAYTEAIRLSPRDPDLWIDRGLMWLDVGDPARALCDIEEAKELFGGYARYYGAMSIYALGQGDAQAAARWQAQALEAQREWDAWVWRR
jgi:tetratricopeptide (TPR) repeat protein